MYNRLTFEPDKGQYRDAYGNFFAGTVLRTDKGVHLVGTVNQQLGVCDDCNINGEIILGIAHIQEIIKDIK